MLAVLMLNRMSSRRAAAKRRAAKNPVKKPALKPRVKAEPRSTEDCCRTCLGSDQLMAIFSSKDVEEKRSEELKLATGLDIRMNDGLSQKICAGCLSTMNIVLLFRQTSHEAEQALMSVLIDNNTEKSEMVYDNYSYDLLGEDIHNDYGQEDAKPTTKQKAAASKRTRMTIPNSSSYQCPECGKVFRMKATFKAHLRFHTNFRVCESCGKRCRNNNQLQEHKRARHGLGKIHKCAYCEYSSATKEALTIHERRHTGERPYVCDHCGATFHRRANLVQHIAIHNPEKNFQCSVCPKRERSRKLLAIHEHKYHKRNKYRYICPICEDNFTRPGNVRQHLLRSHSIPRQNQGPIPRYEMAVNNPPVAFPVDDHAEIQECTEELVPYLHVLQ